MIKTIIVYKRGANYYLHSSSKTTTGVWIATAPFVKIEISSSTLTKGEAVLQALDASHNSIPHPTNWAGLIAPLLELAGVKSWTTFVKHTNCLNVELVEEKLRFIPNRNLGTKEGFEPFTEKTVELSFLSSPDQIGLALEQAMRLCQ